MSSSVTTQLTPTPTLLPPLPKFNSTCVPIQYPCYPGTRYIDPCDCTFYYVCRNTGSVVRQSCARGTAYDHTNPTAYCRLLADVVGKGKCDQKYPWVRCQDSHTNVALQRLQSWCTSSGYLTPPPPKSGGDSGANAGAIAAIVVILLLLAVVVVLIVVYVRKKGNPIPKMKETQCWQNVAWCWREVVCCESDGRDYYEEDPEGGDGDGDPSDSPPYPRSSRTARSSRDAGDGTYHEFPTQKTEQRRSSRRISKHEEAMASGAVGGGYDNRAYDNNFTIEERDSPPPDTENCPAPPAYYRGENYHSRARELNKMDAGEVQTHLDDEGYAMAMEDKSGHHDGSAIPAAIEFGDDGFLESVTSDNPLDNSFTA